MDDANLPRHDHRESHTLVGSQLPSPHQKMHPCTADEWYTAWFSYAKGTAAASASTWRSACDQWTAAWAMLGAASALLIKESVRGSE